MGRSLESMSRSHNLDMSKNPEGTVGYVNKPQTFEEHMKELRQRAEADEWIKRMTAKRNQSNEEENKQKEDNLKELKEKILEAFNTSTNSAEKNNYDKYKTLWEK